MSRIAFTLVLIITLLASTASTARADGTWTGPFQQDYFRCLDVDEMPESPPESLSAETSNPFLRFLQRVVRWLWHWRQHLVMLWRVDHCVQLNQVQVIGSHNSYKIQPSPSLQQILFAALGDLALGFEYTHPPLDEQFSDAGIRQIELDVFVDRSGGLYANPVGPVAVAGAGLPPGPDNDPDGLLEQPGLKVLHIQDIDFRSTCLTWIRCLTVVKTWSDANPRHLPIMILVELKDEPIPDPGFGFVIPELFIASDLDQVDDDIRSVFPDWQVITPDDVRGGRSTLEEAVLMDGWPSLAESRGRVLFALDNGGAIRDLYAADHPSLADRMLFINALPGSPEAGFVKANDPLGDPTLIGELVAQGFIVRTRADADTLEARTNDTTRRDAALASGAQYVSTDYPVPDPAIGTGYVVEIPGGGVARCNPVSADANCVDARLGR